MEEKSQETQKTENKSSYKAWIIFVLIIIGATAPFHYVPSKMKVFPKDNLTFSNTFILEEDIYEIKERYNSANIFEKYHIRQEPLVKKLLEKKLLVPQSNSDD
jgi:hypothetical protein